jgi:hypothetical protein
VNKRERQQRREELLKAKRELDYEINSLDHEDKLAADVMRVARQGFIYDNLDVLLQLTEGHSCSAADDTTTDFRSASNYCIRCALLQAKKQKFVDFDIHLMVISAE